MSKEIERKFLVKKNWKRLAGIDNKAGTFIEQGYIYSSNTIVRVRTITPALNSIQQKTAFLTIKSKPAPKSISRDEYEYEIPFSDAVEMLNLCESKPISKKRYNLGDWEVDEFFGSNRGLTLAEIELTSENQQFSIPNWISTEVTNDVRYYNNYLSTRPFKLWNLILPTASIK